MGTPKIDAFNTDVSFYQKLVADNFDSYSADADIHEIIKRILEHVEARVDILL